MSARRLKVTSAQPDNKIATPPERERERAPKCTAATMAQRVNDVLRLRLAGAQFADILEYANAPTIEGREGGPWGLTEQGVRYVITQSNKLLSETAKQSRSEMFELHIARREALYARCIDKGDERTALAVLRDQAELCGLYDSEAIAELEKAVAELRERLDGGANGKGEK